jgi:hypothetical protein
LGSEPLAVLLQTNLLLLPVVFKLVFCYLAAVNAAKIPDLADINSVN